jgi:hypothetical protein
MAGTNQSFCVLLQASQRQQLINVCKLLSVETLCALAACCRKLRDVCNGPELFGFTRLRSGQLASVFINPFSAERAELCPRNWMLFDTAAKAEVEQRLFGFSGERAKAPPLCDTPPCEFVEDELLAGYHRCRVGGFATVRSSRYTEAQCQAFTRRHHQTFDCAQIDKREVRRAFNGEGRPRTVAGVLCGRRGIRTARAPWEDGLELGVFNGNHQTPKYSVLALFAGHVTVESDWERACLKERARSLYTMETTMDGGGYHGAPTPSAPAAPARKALMVDGTVVYNQGRFLNDYRLEHVQAGRCQSDGRSSRQRPSSGRGAGGGDDADDMIDAAEARVTEQHQHRPQHNCGQQVVAGAVDGEDDDGAGEPPHGRQSPRPPNAIAPSAIVPNAIVLSFEIAGGIPCVCVVATRKIGARQQVFVDFDADFESQKSPHEPHQITEGFYWRETRALEADFDAVQRLRQDRVARACFSASHGRCSAAGCAVPLAGTRACFCARCGPVTIQRLS